MCNSACLFQVTFQADLDNQRWSGHQPGQALLGWRAWAKWKHLADSQQYSSGWQHQMRLLLALYLGRACLKGDSSRWKKNEEQPLLLLLSNSAYPFQIVLPSQTQQSSTNSSAHFMSNSACPFQVFSPSRSQQPRDDPATNQTSLDSLLKQHESQHSETYILLSTHTLNIA